MTLTEVYNSIEKLISSVDFQALWDGFHRYDYAVYNASEVCLNGKLIPRTDDFYANTAILYNGSWTAIFQIDGDEDYDVLASKLIHEMFHAFQMHNNESRFANELEAVQKYEYSCKNMAMKLYENTLLAKLSENGFEQDIWEELLTCKKKRFAEFRYQYLYEAAVEQIEGTANYIELQALRCINEDKYKLRVKRLLTSLCDENALLPIRIGLYESGAFLIKAITNSSVAFNYGFSDTPFSVSILDFVDNTDAFSIPPIYEERAAAVIKQYYSDIEKKIDIITKTPPIAEGNFELLGLNVYDAKYYKGYIYTTYFLSYRDESEIVLNGDYLIQVEGNTIRKIFAA